MNNIIKDKMKITLRNPDGTIAMNGQIQCNPGDIFYIDVTISNSGSTDVNKDFLVEIGINQSVGRAPYPLKYEYMYNATLPPGQSSVTLPCQATGNQVYDIRISVGDYSLATGEWNIDDYEIEPDGLQVYGVDITGVDFMADCSTYNNQSDCEAAGCYWYDNSCHTEPASCTNPTGSEGEEICGDPTYGQDPTHRYKCVSSTWEDQGYDSTCDTQATMTMQDANIPKNGSDTASIIIDGCTNIGSAETHIYYDPNVVKIAEITEGDFENVWPNDDKNGDIKIIAYTTGIVDSPINMCNIKFEPASGANTGDTCKLDLNQTGIFDDPGNSVPHTVIDGTATII